LAWACTTWAPAAEAWAGPARPSVGLRDLLLHAGDLGLDLLDLHALVGRVQLGQHVAGLDDLVVVEQHLGDDAGDARRHRMDVAGNIGVFGFDEVAAAVPHAAAGAMIAASAITPDHDQHALGRSLAGVGGRGAAPAAVPGRPAGRRRTVSARPWFANLP
jgi:hypothetical protein